MNKLVLIFVMFLLAVQSVSVFASEASFHQIEVSHLQHTHDHAEDVQADSSGHHTKDCHHCGHCSGTHLNLVILKSLLPFEMRPNSEIYPQSDTKVRAFVEQAHRPPIA
ncbi:hypothetical protein CKO50_17495 [Pseudoalteromonas sp. HM-SA03]|uniref:DUF2946 family protein n=1 Tax=Pseudoalteromonas sp. HM-SA03 TaxID=2029678 RepID=UPI000BADE99D|nr:DUF2946 family protein [Pseudoalteromonas sp. HM-SA03]PAY00069.1 hypothetical protein CKO50_17495 [Pseudoalteromonas sp. HM-SA03]